MLRWLWRIIMGGRYSKRNITLWSWLRRWASAPILAANYPDMPTARPAGEWLILDTGHWGTLAATHVDRDMLVLSVWKGYEQTHGGMAVRRADLARMLEYLDQGPRGPIRPVL